MTSTKRTEPSRVSVLFCCQTQKQLAPSEGNELHILCSIPIMSGYISIHLSVVLIFYTGNGLAVQNSRVRIHLDGSQLPIRNKGIGDDLQCEISIRVFFSEERDACYPTQRVTPVHREYCTELQLLSGGRNLCYPF